MPDNEPPAELVEVVGTALDPYIATPVNDNGRTSRRAAAVGLRAAHDAGLIVYRDELETDDKG